MLQLKVHSKAKHISQWIHEKWKKAVDQNVIVGGILTDCLSHELLIEKLEAFGDSALKFVCN